MSQNSAFDQTIPVLTEVFSDKPAPAAPAPAAAAPATPATPAAPLPAAPRTIDDLNAHLVARAVTTWTEPEWNLLERRLSERVLQQLQGRVDFVLEQRVRDSMEEVLKHAVTGLANELRIGLHDAIEQIVVRAVAQEVAHLQALKQ